MAKLLKNFRTRLNEAEARTVVVTFGRFNPPTTGHEKLIKAIEKVAVKNKADYRIYPSQSQDPKKNPLSHSDKIKFMRKMFRKYSRNIIDDKSVKTMFNVASQAYKDGYRKLIIVVGQDQVSEFGNLIPKYNGKDGRHGFYDFEDIQVVSAGNRVDPDSEKAKEMTADTMSASVLRKLAADGHFDEWTDEKGKKQLGFKSGVPDTLGDTDKRILFNKVRTGMKLAAINEAFERLFEESVVIVEKAPPDEKIQKWLEDPATKADFKKRYGDEWEEIMYATAWKIYNGKKNEQFNESWNVDEEMDEEWQVKEAKSLHQILAKLKTEVAQDKDIKDREGTQPAKYYAGDMKKSTKTKRAAQFAKQAKMDDDDPNAYKPAPGDASAETKPSKHTKKYQKMFGEELILEAKSLLHIFEDDDEGRMVKSDLSKMVKQAQELMRLIGDEDELPGWAQNKFAIAADYINSVHGYLTYSNEAPRLEQFVFEAITRQDLAGIEKYADRLFAAVGIDVEFTRHFLDRVNDTRNKKDISVAELTRLFKQTYKRFGKKIAQLGPDAEAVLNDMMTDINMPFVLKWDSKNQELDLVAKTVMRKKNFATSNQKFIVSQMNEGAANPAQQAAIAIAKKKKAGKPGYDDEGKKIDEDTDETLRKKAGETGISYGILKKVFDRGVAAWRTGHRPGTTAVQWGFARVNSFATGGKTQKTADADLWAKHKGKSEEVEIDEAGLPPHLAKLFDKDGNFKDPKKQAKFDQMIKRKQSELSKFKVTDVTPKGYGPADEALEYGTDETTKEYKKVTPGEVEEETTAQMIKRIASKTIKKKPYEKAAEILKKVWDRKNKEHNNNPRHDINYYAAEIIRTTGMKLDARILGKMVAEDVVAEGLAEALDNNEPIYNVFRPHSESYYKIFEMAREFEVEATGLDKHLLETDIGKWADFEGTSVPLDIPLVEEEDVELNKPKRGGSKKFYVYVKNDKGNVQKVSFGDTSGLKAKINDPEARKSFVARHQCDQKKDKTTPGYWACRLPMYAKELGLEGGGDYFW